MNHSSKRVLASIVSIATVVLSMVISDQARAQSECDRRLTNPFLYRIVADHHASHLFGTMHVEIDIEHLPAVVRRVLDEASHLTIEAQNPTSAESQQFQELFFKQGTLDLTNELTKREFDILEALLEANGLPGEMAADLSPLGACLMTLPTFKEAMENPNRQSLDDQIAAQFENRSVEPLETAAAVTSAMAKAYDIERLKYRLRHPEDDTVKIRRIYRTGDEGTMTRLMAEERQATPNWYTLMVTDRNSAWLPQVEFRHHAHPRHVAAVGTAHLFGPDGLLQLLRERHFTVERLF